VSSIRPDTPTPRCAVYVRVSTKDQDLAGQESELRTYAAHRGWIIGELYSEKVSATGRAERKEFDRLVRDSTSANRRWADLVVWSLDRFSRDETFTRATQAILDLEKHGIRFHSLKEPTLDTPEDGKPNLGRDVLLALLPVISSFESKRRSERVALAMAELKSGRRTVKPGKRTWGRPRRVTPELASRLLSLRKAGLPWPTVAQRVGLPAGTCRRVGSQARRGLLTFKTPVVQKGAESEEPTLRSE
jgi:DNA invertase Pin-like site-specific DNA recombinase